MGGSVKFIAAGVLIVAAVAYLIVSTTADTAHYFLTIEEVTAMGSDAIDRPVTISGAVARDTLVYDPAQPQVTFAIVQVPADPQAVARAGGAAAAVQAALDDSDAPRLEVVYAGSKPDGLTSGVQPILRGRLGRDGRFYAEEILLKCPSRYQEAAPARGESP